MAIPNHPCRTIVAKKLITAVFRSSRRRGRAVVRGGAARTGVLDHVVVNGAPCACGLVVVAEWEAALPQVLDDRPPCERRGGSRGGPEAFDGAQVEHAHAVSLRRGKRLLQRECIGKGKGRGLNSLGVGGWSAGCGVGGWGVSRRAHTLLRPRLRLVSHRVNAIGPPNEEERGRRDAAVKEASVCKRPSRYGKTLDAGHELTSVC